MVWIASESSNFPRRGLAILGIEKMADHGKALSTGGSNNGDDFGHDRGLDDWFEGLRLCEGGFLWLEFVWMVVITR